MNNPVGGRPLGRPVGRRRRRPLQIVLAGNMPRRDVERWLLPPFNIPSFQILFDSLHSLNNIFTMTEGRKPEEAFSAWAEAGTGSTDNIALR